MNARMSTGHSLSRRDFIAGSAAATAAVVANAHAESAEGDATRLALEGGPKTILIPAKQGPRWGEPERERLDALMQQDTLFYWKGPQKTRFVKRFREICPLDHVMPCSSGTAALHIAALAAGIGPGDEHRAALRRLVRRVHRFAPSPGQPVVGVVRRRT